jgi:hypothetical protein
VFVYAQPWPGANERPRCAHADVDQLLRRPGTRPLSGRRVARIGTARTRRDAAVIRQPARHVQKLADGDLIAVGHDTRKQALDRVVQSKTAACHELQDHGGSERLVDAADARVVTGRDRHPAPDVSQAGRVALDPTGAADHAGRARDARSHDAIERALNVGPSRGGDGDCRRRQQRATNAVATATAAATLPFL